MQQTMTLRLWIILLATAFLLGSSFLFLHIAVETVPPINVAAMRALIAAPLVWMFLRLTGGRMPPLGRDWIPFVILGTLTAAIPFGTIAWGQQHIESGLAGILFGTIPLFSVLLAPLFISEEGFSPTKLVGAVAGLAGVALVVGPKALTGLDAQLLGVVVTLVAALSYTLGAIYARLRPDLSSVAMAAGQMIVGAAILTALSMVVEDPWSVRPSGAALGAIATVAVFSTAVPMLLFFWLVRRAGVTNTSLVPLFMPVVAVALGAAVLSESLPNSALAGLGLILLSAIAVSGRRGAGRGRSSKEQEPTGKPQTHSLKKEI